MNWNKQPHLKAKYKGKKKKTKGSTHPFPKVIHALINDMWKGVSTWIDENAVPHQPKQECCVFESVAMVTLKKAAATLP